MKAFALFSIGAYLVAPVLSEPFERQHEDVNEVWEQIGRSHRDTTIALSIVLKNPNDDAFEERAYQIATPFSPYYRKHMSAEELAAWVKPTDESISKVQDWLSAHGIKGLQNHDIIEAEVDVAAAETLLNSTYSLYRHRASGKLLHGVKEYFLPDSLKEHVEFVAPTIHFMTRAPPRISPDAQDFDSIAKKKLVPDLNTPCDYFVDPACVRKIYNVTYTARANTTASTSIFLSISGTVNLRDLQIYLRQFNVNASEAHAQPQIIHLGQREEHINDETNMDTQIVLGLSWPAKSTYTYTANTYTFGPGRHYKPPHPKIAKRGEDQYLKYFHGLTFAQNPPSSTTDSEGIPEQARQRKYMIYLCKIYARAGARGVSVVFPSGDYGAGQYSHGHALRMDFPAVCPWSTSVGATVFINHTEIACTIPSSSIKEPHSEFASGGGLSQTFKRPKYQDKVVPAYLKANDIVKQFEGIKRFAPNGRGFPDVAAFGIRVPTVDHFRILAGGGTSASSPTVASLITVLNDYEASKGRPPLGFLNPWLYSRPHILNDITEGGFNNDYPHAIGYPTTKGWDAVTGLGSLNFGKMMKDLDDMADAGALGQ